MKKVEIVPYDPTWPKQFQAIANRLRNGLADLALRIDHIGSTSVPNLPAKDIIDIQITVSHLSPQFEQAMLNVGFIRPEGVWRDHRPPGFDGPESDWQKFLFKQPLGHRLANIHVRIQGRPNQRYPILFRDYLRAHPASAEAYAQLKRYLAQNLADLQMYPEVKDPVVDLIYYAAEAWAETTDWHQGASDG